jgi:hypothetical protein
MMKKRKMNRRGDIPVTILVIGVLAVCLLAFLSFYISDRATKNTLKSIDIVEKVSLEKEKISVYSNIGMSQSEIEILLGVKTDVQGKFIQLEQEGILCKQP